MWWETLLGVLAGVALVYLVLVAALWRAYRHNPDTAGLRSALRLLPDLVRLLRRLAADPTLPPGVRVRLLLLVAYLLLPIDLIPDIVPVLGCADDALIVAVALRSVVRHAGADALEHHWPGTREGLQVVQRLAGLRAIDAPTRTPKQRVNSAGRKESPRRVATRPCHVDGENEREPRRSERPTFARDGGGGALLMGAAGPPGRAPRTRPAA